MAMAERSTPEQLAELHQEMHARYREAKDMYYEKRKDNAPAFIDYAPDFYDYVTWLEIEFESLEEILNS